MSPAGAGVLRQGRARYCTAGEAAGCHRRAGPAARAPRWRAPRDADAGGSGLIPTVPRWCVAIAGHRPGRLRPGAVGLPLPPLPDRARGARTSPASTTSRPAQLLPRATSRARRRARASRRSRCAARSTCTSRPGPPSLRRPSSLVTDEFDGRLTALSMLVAWVAGHRARRPADVARPPARARRCPPRPRGGARATATLLLRSWVGSVHLYLGSMPFVYHEAYAWAIAMASARLLLLGLLQRPPRRRRGGRRGLHARRGAEPHDGGLGVRGGAGPGRPVVPPRPRATSRSPSAGADARPGRPRAPRGRRRAQLGEVPAPVHLPARGPGLDERQRAAPAALEANGGDLVSTEILPATLVNYFRPDGIRFTALFPYITLPAEVPQNYGGSFLDQVYRTGSVVAFMPLLLLLSIWGLVTAFRRAWRAGRARSAHPAPRRPRHPRGHHVLRLHRHAVHGRVRPLLFLGGAIGFIDLARRLGPTASAADGRRSPPCSALAVFGFVANLAVSITTERVSNPGTPLTQYVKVQERSAAAPRAIRWTTASSRRRRCPTRATPTASRSSATATPSSSPPGDRSTRGRCSRRGRSSGRRPEQPARPGRDDHPGRARRSRQRGDPARRPARRALPRPFQAGRREVSASGAAPSAARP